MEEPSTNIEGVAAAATAVSTLTDHDKRFMKIAIMCLSAIHNNRFPQDYKKKCEFEGVSIHDQNGSESMASDAGESTVQSRNQPDTEGESLHTETRIGNNEKIKKVFKNIMDKYSFKNLCYGNNLSYLHGQILCCDSEEEKKEAFQLLVSKITKLPKFLKDKEKKSILLLSVLSKSLVHYRTNKQQNRPNRPSNLINILSSPKGQSYHDKISEKIKQEKNQLFKNLLESYIELFEQFISEHFNSSTNIEFEFIKHYEFLNEPELNVLRRELDFIYQMHNIFL